MCAGRPVPFRLLYQHAALRLSSKRSRTASQRTQKNGSPADYLRYNSRVAREGHIRDIHKTRQSRSAEARNSPANFRASSELLSYDAGILQSKAGGVFHGFKGVTVRNFQVNNVAQPYVLSGIENLRLINVMTNRSAQTMMNSSGNIGSKTS